MKVGDKVIIIKSDGVVCGNCGVLNMRGTVVDVSGSHVRVKHDRVKNCTEVKCWFKMTSVVAVDTVL